MSQHAAVSAMDESPLAVVARRATIGLVAFLTLVDLFAAQAILPSLAQAYGASPAEMGLAVNACTFGMAASGVLVALLARRIERRRAIALSLALLALPTSALAFMPDLAVFAALRVAQGVFMAAAFTLTMTYLSEQSRSADTAGALAAYITGNVASNLFGRLVSAAAADHLGLAGNFALFAGLNLAGAGLVALCLMRTVPMAGAGRSPFPAWLAHLRDPALAAAFGLGFVILFVFIGTFTFVNFVLAAEPLALPPMARGLVYFVFLPSLLTTPFAGRAALAWGARRTAWASLALAGVGLPLMLAGTLAPVLAGMALVAVGTFFAQAAATGYVGRRATAERGAASGMYLASYYLGGLAGTAVLGAVFDIWGWLATVAGLGVALAFGAALAARLRA